MVQSVPLSDTFLVVLCVYMYLHNLMRSGLSRLRWL